ncbi:DUF7133 domain-containing protein [Rhodopirellula sallentina]|uniref:Membrane-bound dehydrogenase domain-containing protein n=1 Tax=Rhodopirellula sallentina SM41 TaxID=1263870 RepID=M5UGZ8_9BACT|nr:discoidin domain-containing protein [Rhodopirellula sallentina]EMI55293.1 membrane-bound dehydrogenase domain-containing protein [Rhodopirellula sallentina SM41]
MGILLSYGNAAEIDASSKAPPLSPEESIATMQVQPGYSVVPVLTEPHVEEPSVVVWDGNGRMYVVEMRTYMQDIDGRNQLAPKSRVSRHEDTDGDGVYDKHTVFADNLVLPRMILPLLDSVVIGETNTLDLKSYRDTDDDGVADEIELWHEGGPRGGNLEHQPSGLVWNIDNWIYTTYTGYRLRFTNQKVKAQPLHYNTGQWGLTHDDVGRMYYSTAGGENPAYAFQQPIIYGQISLSGEQVDGFREVFPIDNVPDVQGGPKRIRDDNTLTQFTGGGGQSVYRGDAMPSDFDGDLIICEPVGRLIRRANVTDDRGRITLANEYDGSEFIAATDPNFRPVNSATGPDGCLYIVDMYRGIIQEGNWVRKGSYLRKVVEDYELDRNIGRGRIYRIEHETTRRGPQPRMLDETPHELLRHLSHPNGWWRSEAQKLIILHADRSVVPQLERLTKEAENALARLHALWTLEGLDAISKRHLIELMADPDPRVRAAAIRISEPYLSTDDQFDPMVKHLGEDESPAVVIQTLLSVNHGGHPNAKSITNWIVDANRDNPNVESIAKQYRSNIASILAERKKFAQLQSRNKALADSVVRGKTIYSTLCITCHGENGKGHPAPQGGDLHLAPPLAGSPRVRGHKARLVRILLQGLIGPIENKNYADGLMMPLATNSDEWIADVANYVRNSWGNQASRIRPTDIRRIRNESASRIGPWTLEDLAYFDPPAMSNRSEWKLNSNVNKANVVKAIDSDLSTRWDTASYQVPGQWLEIELPEPVTPTTLVLDTKRSKGDYPRGYDVEVSEDGKTWSEPVAQGYGDGPVTNIELDTDGSVRYLRITQVGAAKRNYWSIHDMQLHAIPQDSKPPVSMAESLAKVDSKTLAEQARHEGNPQRGAALFYGATISCAKCHDPESGPRLGPDLSVKREGITDQTLVDAILDPSKEIHQDFQQVSVITADGLVLTGFPVRENDDEMVIREPAGGKEIVIAQDDIDDVFPMKVSAMPAGLVNQLTDASQFSDLIRFLIEIQNGGAEALTRLKANR